MVRKEVNNAISAEATPDTDRHQPRFYNAFMAR